MINKPKSVVLVTYHVNKIERRATIGFIENRSVGGVIVQEPPPWMA